MYIYYSYLLYFREISVSFTGGSTVCATRTWKFLPQSNLAFFIIMVAEVKVQKQDTARAVNHSQYRPVHTARVRVTILCMVI